MDKSKAAAAIFDKHARLYQEKYMDTDLYHDTFDLFCEHVVQENAEILELACGPGNITAYLLKKRPDFKWLGTDLSPNMIELAKSNNPGAEFQLLDCRELNRLNKRYDGIVCGFALPYLSKEEAIRLIGDAAGALKPGGILYLSTMEDDYGKSGPRQSSTGDWIYMHYHQADYLTQALDQNGFNILHLQRKIYSDGSGIIDLVIIAGCRRTDLQHENA